MRGHLPAHVLAMRVEDIAESAGYTTRQVLGGVVCETSAAAPVSRVAGCRADRLCRAAGTGASRRNHALAGIPHRQGGLEDHQESPLRQLAVQGDLRIDFITPARHAGKPVIALDLGVSLMALKFLDDLLEWPGQAVLLDAADACLVNLPDPACSGLHKLLLAAERGARHPKYNKDMLQALSLIEWHLQRPGASAGRMAWPGRSRCRLGQARTAIAASRPGGAARAGAAFRAGGRCETEQPAGRARPAQR